MAIYIGSNKPKFYIGSSKVKKIYRGETKVWSGASVVTYHVDSSNVQTEEIDEGLSVLTPSSFTPTKTGYTFVGWREDSTASSSVLSTKISDGEPITLYAVFSQTFTLTTYNGSNTASTTNGNRYYNNGNSVNPSFTLSENALSGWTKYGWADAADFTADVADGGSVTLTANKTYYALYTQNITVTYYNNSSTASTSTKARYARAGGSWAYSNPTFNLTVAAVSGWTVRGWSTSSDANGAISYNSATNFTRDSNVTLYASWTANVTVTYYNNSSTAATSTKAMYRGYKGDVTGATFNLSEASVSGWTARGWSTSNAANATITYNNTTNFTRTSNCTLYASWTANVTVTYYNNSATAGTSTKAMYRGYKGDVTAATFNLSEASVSGWTARGWSTSSAANATITYSNATNFTRTSACTLYASWSKTVTVTYNGNSQTGGSTAASTGTAYRGYKGDITNASISLRANGFTRTNYTFYRWATTVLYKPGDVISVSADTSVAAYWLATTTDFGYTGGMQSFTARAGVTYLLQVWGAQGGACPLTVTEGSNVPGYGGWAGGYIAFSADSTLYVGVGGMGSSDGTGGYNGGGTGAGWANPPSGVSTIGRGSGGGGATHIGWSNAVLASTPLSSVFLAAGGGGAVGGTIGWFSDDDYRWGVRVVNGGNGGGVNGNDAASGGSAGGTGGTQSAGGTNTAGVGYGSYGTGGTAPEAYLPSFSGGGAGLYGGGGGYHSGAGGGSGYIGGVASGSMQNGVRTGHGYASITISSVG